MKARCLNPRPCWVCGTIRSKADGVISPHIVFSEGEALRYFQSIYGTMLGMKFMRKNEVTQPCGKCAACQIRKRKDWTVRLSHEASCYEDNCCFVTLTYNDDSIPVTCFGKFKTDDKMLDRGLGELPLMTLHVKDAQDFIKRLRRHLEYIPKSARLRNSRDHVTTPIRYYCVGEYGGKYGRPHYHLMIFGWRPSDMEVHSSRDGHLIYRSAQIEKLWKFGFSTVEPVQGGVAKYCSRYVTKKFARLNNDDPFADCIVPEFFLQSVRHGGIGSTWFDQNYEAMLQRGYASVKVGSNYSKFAIPSFYWRRCRQKNLCLWLQLRDERIQFMRSSSRLIEGLEDLQRSVDCYALNEKRLSQYELF